jgi:hypothetical protein
MSKSITFLKREESGGFLAVGQDIRDGRKWKGIIQGS